MAHRMAPPLTRGIYGGFELPVREKADTPWAGGPDIPNSWLGVLDARKSGWYSFSLPTARSLRQAKNQTGRRPKAESILKAA